MDKRLLGRKFGGNFLFLPGFVRVLIFDAFQDAGKRLSRRQWLNKRVKCKRGRLAICRRHQFIMPSKPQAFLNFKDCIYSETSEGRKLTGVSSSTVASGASSWASTCRLWLQVKLVTLRVAAYRQSVRFGAKPLETHDQRFFFNWTLAVIVLT
jgi:hypothetical protein